MGRDWSFSELESNAIGGALGSDLRAGGPQKPVNLGRNGWIGSKFSPVRAAGKFFIRVLPMNHPLRVEK